MYFETEDNKSANAHLYHTKQKITIQGQNFVEVSKEIEQFLLLQVKENESAIKNSNRVFKFGTVVSKNAKQRGRKPTPKRKRTERP